MSPLRTAAAHRVLTWLAVVVAVVGCGERVSAPPPAAPVRLLARVQCLATPAARQLACVSEGAAKPIASGVNADLIVGGQNTFVTLTSSNVTYAGDVFSFTTTVQNLIGQALGTTDGTTLDPAGVRVFFDDQPVATSGSGTIDFVNPVGGGALVDGYASFTHSNQPYYQYNELLSPHQTSAAKGWAIHVPSTVGSFGFSVYVSAPVPYPTGYVVVSPATATLRAGGATQTLSAVVKDVVSRTVPDAVSWSSSNSGVASVDANTGVVTPIADGVATITATSTTRTGTAVIMVSAASGPNTTITGAPATPTVGSPATITVQAKTAGGANITLGGDAVVLNASAGSLSAATDNNDGTYTATLTSTAATTISITGTINGAAIGHPGTVTFTAGTPTSMVKGAGDGQSATAGIAVAVAPAVTITDAHGNPVSGVSVTFAIASGGAGAAVAGSPATTNASGIATAGSWTLGTTAGVNTLTASATGLSTVTFNATGTAGPPASATIQSTNPQSAAVNAAASSAPSVLITDANNNPVPGVQVTFAVTSGGGSVTGATPTTNTSGIATIGSWTLGTTSGTSNNTLSATAATGSATASFTASATPAPVHHFVVEAVGGGAIAAQLAGASFNVKVTAQDQFNNTAASFTGTAGFTTTPSGGVTAGGTSAAFTAGVLASHAITLGTPGDVTLTATRSSGGSETGTSTSFQVQQAPTAVSDAPTGTSVPGDAYHATFNTPFALATLGVLANDTRGFPLATVASFGGDSLGGVVTGHAAGSAVSPLPGHADGSLVVNANGSIAFTPPTGFTGLYITKYRISNVRGTSDAQLTIAVGVRPAATDDTYPINVLGNVPINTATSSTFNVTANDAGDARVLAVGTATNGTVILAPGGTFTFTPNVGYTGPASFTYTVTNGFGTTASKTVSLTVSGIAWFINKGAGAGGDGRFGTPFNDLSTAFAAATKPLANQPIFLYANGTAYTGGVTLLAGQKLVGAGATDASFAAALGVAWPADAGPQPAIGGTKPTVNTGLTLGSGNTIKGFALSAGTLSGTTFGTLTVSDVGINTTSQALNLTTGTIAGNFTQVRSTGGTNNVLLSGVATSGTTVLGTSADVLSGATGDAFVLSGQNGSFTYAGSITNTAALTVNIANKTGGTVLLSGDINPASAARGISISNNSTNTNTITFSGTDQKISAGTASGVSLATNTGATINFTGGALAITTTTGAGFSATGGGTINVTGATNSITSAGGISLNVVNTTIGASGLAFRSINANGGSNGIVLTNTGTGELTVSGDGATQGSGGTIQNTTGADGAVAGNGVYVSNAHGPKLNWMFLSNHANHAIYGTEVTGFTLNKTRITGTNGTSTAADEGSVGFDNLYGSASITNSYIDGGFEDNVRVVNGLTTATASLNRLTMTADTIGLNSASGNDGVLVAGYGTASVSATIQSSKFLGSRANNIAYVINENASGDVVISSNNIANAHPGKLGSDFGLYVAHASNGAVTYQVSGNTVNNAGGSGIEVDRGAGGNGSMTGTITGNFVGTAGVAGTGSTAGTGIFVGLVGSVSLGSGVTHTTTISGNTVRQFGNYGFRIVNRGTGANYFNAQVKNNNVAEPYNTATTQFPSSGLRFEMGSSSGPPADDGKSCFDISGNVVTNAGTNGGAEIRLFGRFSSKTALPGLTAAGANAFIQGQNTITTSGTTVNATSTNVFQSSCPPT